MNVIYMFKSQFIVVTKKMITKGHDYKGGLLYIFGVFNINIQTKSKVRIL
jgi:hypothetical protein